MSDDAQAYAGTAEGQGPVEIDAELARHLQNKREELFEEFEIRDAFPPEVLSEARARTDGVHEEIEDELDTAKTSATSRRGRPTPSTPRTSTTPSPSRNAETTRLWVHIADVTHYVHPGSEMWAEAVKRGNTVYLPAYTIHMLPPALAETVCSLVPEEDRLAHTVEMEIKKDTLSFESIDIYKSVIHSNERLTYTAAEHLLEEPETAEDVLEDQSVDLAEKTERVCDLADRSTSSARKTARSSSTRAATAPTPSSRSAC